MSERRAARSTTVPPKAEPPPPGGAGARAAGRALRKRLPRPDHGKWKAPDDRTDPIAILERDGQGRLPQLLPLRYARMATSPFAFYRGAASIMASDLQHTPNTGIETQIAGDAHLANYGAYATPERRRVFDINDFDETALGAWEWDVKRLCASVAILARDRGFRDRDAALAVAACAQSYRERMAIFAEMRVLDVWYARIDETFLERAAPKAFAPLPADLESRSDLYERMLPRLVADPDGAQHIEMRPPRIFRPDDAGAFLEAARKTIDHYHRSLSTDRRALIERFRFADAAYKVVGVGSVGTRCAVALLIGPDPNDPFFLQVKEARESCFARYVGACGFENEGERVVAGQKLMQAASDPFLGWTRSPDGYTYYVRQLFDLKRGIDLPEVSPVELARYAALCGWALARGHAKASGKSAEIAGYLGSSDAFDRAMVAFAAAYAEQNRRDYESLLAAIEAKRIVTA